MKKNTHLRGWLLGALLLTAACGDPRYQPPASPAAPAPPSSPASQGAVSVGGTAQSSRFSLSFEIGAGGRGQATNGAFTVRETQEGIR